MRRPPTNRAERTGFEPAVRLLPHGFSKPVHSTTLPPLRAKQKRAVETFFNTLFHTKTEQCETCILGTPPPTFPRVGRFCQGWNSFSTLHSTARQAANVGRTSPCPPTYDIRSITELRTSNVGIVICSVKTRLHHFLHTNRVWPRKNRGLGNPAGVII